MRDDIQMAMRGLFLVFMIGVFSMVGAPVQATDERLEKKLDTAFAAGELSGLHGVLILHRGDILAERYYPGEDQDWGRPMGVRTLDAAGLHDLRSVTKSVVGLLYGIALAEGLVPDPDTPLIEAFPEYPDLAADPERRKITVRHALAMKMGTDWNEQLPYTSAENSEIAMELAPDRYRFVLDRPLVQVPGTAWTYNGGATAVIAHLIAKGAGRPIDDYARDKLFGPLGITEFDWARGADGVPSAASGLRMTIHDLGKIGRMMMAGGTWEGRQIVPQSWVALSLTPHAEPEPGIRYGLFWWLSGEGDPPYWAAGFGNGGQRLFFNKGSELVVVVFAGNYNRPDAWQLPVKIIRDFAFPTIRQR